MGRQAKGSSSSKSERVDASLLGAARLEGKSLLCGVLLSRDILGRCLGDSLLVREESGMAARDEESWSMSMDIGDRERVGRMAHTRVHLKHVQDGHFRVAYSVKQRAHYYITPL